MYCRRFNQFRSLVNALTRHDGTETKVQKLSCYIVWSSVNALQHLMTTRCILFLQALLMSICQSIHDWTTRAQIAISLCQNWDVQQVIAITLSGEEQSENIRTKRTDEFGIPSVTAAS